MIGLIRALKHARYHISRRAFASFKYRFHRAASNCFPRWPIPVNARHKQANVNGNGRVGYFIWQYPVLSQTFVQREVAALNESGLSVVVVSDVPPDGEFECSAAGPSVKYLHAMDEQVLRRYKRYFFFRSPLLYLNLFVYVLCHGYHGYKSFDFDRTVFSKAIALAALLKEGDINHIHSPWADNCALIALLASRLLGISYSVQARAHDVHRKTYLNGLTERISNADFVITNTQYNASHIKALIGAPTAGRLHVIHNGVNLDQFQPDRRENSSSTLRMLCVARLIEQKGLIYLLKACRLLADKGYAFTCEIIGGPESSLFMNYYVALKKLHRNLALEDRVFFLGTQPFERVLEKYRETDIFVLPSVVAQDGSRDITPNVLIEAMAMKLSVVSTTVTGIPEIVEDGVSGILVPPNDESALAEAVIKLVQDGNLRKWLGENARKRIEEKFDISKNISRYIDLFSGKQPLTGHETFTNSDRAEEVLRDPPLGSPLSTPPGFRSP
jgi:glycosyltransferase involved in cell wall biosynthesis